MIISLGYRIKSKIATNFRKWATWEEINTLVKNGEFIKHRWEFVNKFIRTEIEDS